MPDCIYPKGDGSDVLDGDCNIVNGIWTCCQQGFASCPNNNNIDTNGDSFVNACDFYDDNDGILDTTDNCPLLTTVDQLNMDGDA